MKDSKKIFGYTFGTSEVPTSPVTDKDFELMKKSVLFGEEDIKYLKLSYDVLKDYLEEILDVWYGFVGSNPHLLSSFSSKDEGKPISEYLASVRKRFGQWILDTASAEYDQDWLNYQYEIGLRHHRTKKNKTDNVKAAEHVPFRDLFLLIFPITFTLKPFLAKKGILNSRISSSIIGTDEI